MNDKQPKTWKLCCMGCAKPYSEFGLDVVLPDHQWQMLSDRPGGGGVLCAQCIVDRARLHGATVVKAWLEDAPATPRARPADHLLRVAIAAAELLEREAAVLKECSTMVGEWGEELDVQHDYERMMCAAKDLRDLCVFPSTGR